MELTVKIEESPKKHPENSQQIIECISAATAGFWEGFLLLNHGMRHRIKSATIAVSIASDGVTPITARLDMTVHDLAGWTETDGRLFSRITHDNTETIHALFRDQMRTVVSDLLTQRQRFFSSEVAAYDAMLPAASTQKPA